MRIADLAIGTAVHTNQPVYLEPANGDAYSLRVEDGEVVAEASISSAIGRAAVARLALVAGLDLAADHPASARVAVRCGSSSRDVLITVRHGDALRADLVALPAPTDDAAISTDPEIGEQIGNYTIVEALGHGGMGVVYQVAHSTLDRRYALKMLLPDVIADNPDAGEQFLREARLASRIRHPNIVDVFDYGHAKRRPYLVMELIAGESLNARIEREGAIEPAHAMTIAKQLASALSAAHAAGVIHADVTPSNILLDEHGAVKLLDFGLARLRGDRGNQDSEFVMGTPAYIAPEQIRGGSASEHSDQYGFGATLFHLVTGAPPFPGDDVRKVCMMHIQAPIPAMVSPHGALSPKFVALVARCLEKQPASRFPDMRSVLAALDEVERLASRRDWTKWLSR